MHLERFKSLRESGELESHVGCQQTEFLVREAALLPMTGTGTFTFCSPPRKSVAPPQTARFQAPHPSHGQARRVYRGRTRPGDLRLEGGVDDGGVAQVFEDADDGRELDSSTLAARVDDLAVGEVEEQEVTEGLGCDGRMDAVGGFELEETTSPDEDVEEWGFGNMSR